MNEQIKKLAEEAGGQYPRGIYPGAILFYPKDLERFAELIMQKCTDLVEVQVNQTGLVTRTNVSQDR